MDVGRAFRYVFADPRWPATMAIAALLLLVPVLGWIIFWGYGVRIVGAVVAGTDVPLPPRNGWPRLFVGGLKALVVVFAWSLLPTVLALLPRAALQGADGWTLLLPLLGLVLSVVAGVVTAAAVARVAMTGSILAGIEGGPVLRLVGRNLGDYLLIFLLVVLLGALVGCVGGLAVLLLWAGGAAESGTALVGAFLAFVVVAVLVLPYLQFVVFHLYGQAYYRATPAAWRPTLD